MMYVPTLLEPDELRSQSNKSFYHKCDGGQTKFLGLSAQSLQVCKLQSDTMTHVVPLLVL